ncbi:hypothetical protein [Natronomonas sp. LN261]|uniref:hypothetical protein n=1 Tax=Natronomonas sp. LN261 TaxID=2750669 RepID=UPI0015EFA98A|nr:hypothetical protein [Natronomonas sp. LN261]
MTGKSNRQLDREAFQPRGEATHVPDHHLDSRHGGHDRLDSEGYPNADESTSKACRGCGQPISAKQRKCTTCLEHHIESVGTTGDEHTAPTPVPRVIFAIVEATCDYTALAKGAAACTLLQRRRANPLEDSQLIDDVAETPAATLHDTWGELPAAVRIGTEQGRKLLSVATKHIDRADESDHGNGERSLPRLYDESGRSVLNREQIESWTDTADGERWLIPILGAEQHPTENRTKRRENQRSNTEHIHCRRCEETTPHRFSGHEQLPEEAWDGNPIWQCQACGTARFGPVPE